MQDRACGTRPGHTVSASMSERPLAVRRWLAGHAAAARAQRSLQAAEGPRPDRAVRQLLSALSALETMGRWPAPRDPVSERAVDQVRERWARIQRRARADRS